MSHPIVFSLALLSAVLLSLPSYADDGDEDEIASSILSCFHPSADYRGVEMGQMYSKPGGKQAVDGVLHFAGGFSGNRYTMNFTIVFREVDGEKEFKVVPGEDTAPFPPSQNCRFRAWN